MKIVSSKPALALLLLTLAGCGSAPVSEAPINQEGMAPMDAAPVAAAAEAPTAAVPAAVAEVPVESAAAPVLDVAAKPIAPPAAPPAPTPVVTKAKPAAKPAPEPKPATVAKPSPAPAAEVVARDISGTLKLVAGKGQSVSAGEISEGLVYFLPKAGNPKPKPGRYSINTRSKGFIPETLVVTQGSTVRFPNVDTIIHNVYSRSPGNSFDLGYYGPGKSPEYTFNTAGLAIVNCTVHHTMRANVVVLATPYYARPGKDGRYQIKDIPPGPGTLVFWHPRATAKSVQASAPLGSGGVQTLIASKAAQVH